MALVKIETRKSWSTSQKKKIMGAVLTALIEALKVPENDPKIRFKEYLPDDFHVSSDTTENFILIEVSMFAGRSLQAKKKLYQGIIKNLGKLGVIASDVLIVLNDIPLENWGIHGGIPASEVDLGFKVGV